MNKLIRYWNQNRLKIIITILIIVLIIVVIQIINNFLANIQGSSTQTEWKVPDLSRPTESVLSGEEIPEETADKNAEIIKKFVDYCNEKSYQDAYNLLSQDCKEEVFNNIETFIEDYINEIFDTEKSYILELWFSTTQEFTYRIIYINDDILSSGTVDIDNNKEDYITVVRKDDGYRLNISNYIYSEEINESNNQSNIEITVNASNKFRSYEVYNITIKNSSDKTILLCSGSNGNDICLTDTNDMEYDSIINEIPLINPEFAPGEQRTIDIRFYKLYNLYRQIDKITFKNIIIDKESYDINQNNIETTSISIDF